MKAAILDAGTLGADVDLSALEQCVDSLDHYSESLTSEVLSRLVGCQIAIVNKVVLNEEHFKQLPELRLIAVTATGTNNIDLEAAARHGVRVVNVIKYGKATVVQHTFSLILALSNNLLNYVADVKAGAWGKSRSFCLMDYPIRELEGKTLGIIGYGELGQGAADMGKAFGMNVLVAQSSVDNQNDVGETIRVSLTELLRRSDVISMHCLLSAKTLGMIGMKELELMKSDAIIINTSRGGLIDEDALAGVLRARGIGGAATDVLTEEPPVDGNPLLSDDLPNLIVTPHCAWASREARQRLVDLTAKNISLFISQQPQRFVV